MRQRRFAGEFGLTAPSSLFDPLLLVDLVRRQGEGLGGAIDVGRAPMSDVEKA